MIMPHDLGRVRIPVGAGWHGLPHPMDPPPRVECTCVHVYDYHEDGGTCRVMLTDSLGTEYAECDCPEYKEAP